MDLVERMIRIEQRVSASFGKKITYNQTDYYKSLSEKERKAFESYLKRNKRKKFLLGFLLLTPLLLLACLRMQVTGNIIRGAIEDNTKFDIALLEPLLAFIVLAAIVIFLLTLAFKKRRNTKFEKNFEVLENVFLQKGMVKHFY